MPYVALIVNFNDYTNIYSCLYTAVECPPLSLSNGIVTVTGINPGDIANYNCNVNFTLVGSDIRTCEASGNIGSWSGSDPECFSKYERENIIFLSHFILLYFIFVVFFFSGLWPSSPITQL